MNRTDEIRRIAMWSPPRARSTMMMRVFEALGCAVFDEPFYAYWLKAVNRVNDPGFRVTIEVPYDEAARDTDHVPARWRSFRNHRL